jgi:hypothetical protein
MKTVRAGENMQPNRLRIQLMAFGALYCLTGCTSSPRPRSAEPDTDESTEAADGGPTRDAASPSSDSSDGSRVDASAPANDGGAPVLDASTAPIIGTIDPNDVTLVEAEAAAPMVAGCSLQTKRNPRSPTKLPASASPLSVTPDGRTWAYALQASVHLDASAPASDSGGLDADSDESAPEDEVPAFEVHVESESIHATLVLPNDQDSTRGAALDSSGRSLVTTLADTTGFVLWELNEEEDGFELAPNQPFVRLNALADNGGVRMDKPVFSASGVRLYARELKPGNGVLQLVLRGGQWETEARIVQPELQAQLFAVTASSTDDLTVFGWSDTDDVAIAWWRPRADEPFDQQLELGEAPIFGVSDDCRDWWTLGP